MVLLVRHKFKWLMERKSLLYSTYECSLWVYPLFNFFCEFIGVLGITQIGIAVVLTRRNLISPTACNFYGSVANSTLICLLKFNGRIHWFSLGCFVDSRVLDIVRDFRTWVVSYLFRCLLGRLCLVILGGGGIYELTQSFWSGMHEVLENNVIFLKAWI